MFQRPSASLGKGGHTHGRDRDRKGEGWEKQPCMTHVTRIESPWSDSGGNAGRMVPRKGRERRIRADVHGDEVVGKRGTGWICAVTAAQGCNDADAGSTGTRNRGRDARTPFRFHSRGEDTFTYVWPLVPCLPTAVLGTIKYSRKFSNLVSPCSRSIKRILRPSLGEIHGVLLINVCARPVLFGRWVSKQHVQ